MPNIPTRLNNPGDIKDPKTGTFKKFKNPQEGFLNLKNDLNAKITGNTSTGLTGKSTLREFANKWAPPSDNNDSEGYAQNLAKKLKVTADTPIGSLKNRLDEFAGAIADNEGYQGPRVLGTSQVVNPLQEESTGKLKPEEFAAKIKAKYPQYKDIDDKELTQKIINKYPQYADSVEGATTNKSDGFITDIKLPKPDEPAPTPSNPDPTAPGNVIADVKKGDYAGALGSGIRNVGNSLTFGGSEVLGDEIGKSLAYFKEKGKGLLGGTDNSKYVEESNPGRAALGALGVGAGAYGTTKAIVSGGNLVQGMLTKPAKILFNPVIKQAIPSFEKMTATEQTDALARALQAGSKTEQAIFQKAMKVIEPKYIAENPDIFSFLERNPKVASGLGLVKKGGKFLLRAGLDIAGLKTLSNILK